MTLTAPQDWTFPIPIVYGPGRVKEIASLCAATGAKRPLLVTDRGSRTLPYIDEIANMLRAAGLGCEIYSDISPNPRDTEIAKGKAAFRAGDHDGVVAVGGGSGMDGGKAIATIANNDIDLMAFEFEQTPPDMSDQRPFAPLICVPTTAGTGAETEGTAMVTDTARMMKVCTWHPQFRPAYAVLDPELTIGLPITLTTWTGVDALVHAIEGYVVPGFHPLCDGAALEGMRLIGTWLERTVSEPGNIEARGGMLAGSCLAGISFLKGLGLVHAISHMVGAEYDTHHGLTNAIVLPAVLRFNESAIARHVPHMSHALGLAGASFDDFYLQVCGLLDRLEIPKSLHDIGVPLDCAEGIAIKAIQDSAASTNPRAASVGEIQLIVEQALTSGR